MRTIETKIYKINELSETAQNVAHDEFLNSSDFFEWSNDEFRDSLAKFCELIGFIQWTDYDIPNNSISYKTAFDYQGEKHNFSGLRAWKWLENNGWFDLAKKNANGDCTMTGVFTDSAFFDPIHKLANTPKETPFIEQLFCECLQAGIYAASKEYEYQREFDQFVETSNAYEWEYLENGTLY